MDNPIYKALTGSPDDIKEYLASTGPLQMQWHFKDFLKDNSGEDLKAFTMAAMRGLLSQNDIHLMRVVADERGVSSAVALANTAIEVAKATLSELSKHQ